MQFDLKDIVKFKIGGFETPELIHYGYIEETDSGYPNYIKGFYSVSGLGDYVEGSKLEKVESGTTIDLIPLELKPLSSQLSKITGDSYNLSHFTNVDGSEVIASGIIVHKDSGVKFNIPNKLWDRVDGYNLFLDSNTHTIRTASDDKLVARISNGALDFSGISEGLYINKSAVKEAYYKGFLPLTTFEEIQSKVKGYSESYAKGGSTYAKGGYVDLFEEYEQQPPQVGAIYDKYEQKIIDGDFDYSDSAEFLKEMKAIGYTFEYGLDNEPYGLRPIGVDLNELEGYEEYAKGGEIKMYDQVEFEVPYFESKLKYKGEVIGLTDKTANIKYYNEDNKMFTTERELSSISKFAKGGNVKRSTHSINQDRRRLSQEPHEQAYLSKRTGDYLKFEEGGEIDGYPAREIIAHIKSLDLGELEAQKQDLESEMESGLLKGRIYDRELALIKREIRKRKGDLTDIFEDGGEISDSDRKKSVEMRRKILRDYGSKIEGLEARLDNPNARLSDSFISGADRAKLYEIEKVKKELYKELEFLNKQIGKFEEGGEVSDIFSQVDLFAEGGEVSSTDSEFVKYVLAFYGIKGDSVDKVKLFGTGVDASEVKKAEQELKTKDSWGDGDSVDREKARDLIAKDRIVKLEKVADSKDVSEDIRKEAKRVVKQIKSALPKASKNKKTTTKVLDKKSEKESKESKEKAKLKEEIEIQLILLEELKEDSSDDAELMGEVEIQLELLKELLEDIK
jgi:hypothetical protein